MVTGRGRHHRDRRGPAQRRRGPRRVRRPGQPGSADPARHRHPDRHHRCHGRPRSPARRGAAGFLDFAAGGVLTAHNAPFDVGFLAAACTGRPALARPAGAGHGHAGPAAARRRRGPELQAGHAGGLLRRDRPSAPSRAGRRPGHRGGAGRPAGPAVHDRHTDPRPAQCGGAGRRAPGRPPICPPPRRSAADQAAEQRYATPEGARAGGHEEAAGDHRDRAVEGRCGEDSRDGGDDRPDSAGHGRSTR